MPAHIVTLGAGRMGRGIAHAFAYAGHSVTMIDLKPRSEAELAQLQRAARAEIEASLGMLAQLDALAADAIASIMARIEVVGRAAAQPALARARVIFEAVPEVMAAKQAALSAAANHALADAIIASTTSTFLVDALCGAVARPERFLNAHWLNPAYIVPLVELSPHAGTAPAVLAELRGLLESIGKVPVVCAASPGYIVPRIQALAMNEAARMVEQGLASAADIDKATRYGFGFRFAALGLIEFIDFGGNDILYYASQYLERELGSERYRAPAIVQRLMEEGKIGLKSGAGFYDYAGRDTAAYRKDVMARMLTMLRELGLARPPRL